MKNPKSGSVSNELNRLKSMADEERRARLLMSGNIDKLTATAASQASKSLYESLSAATAAIPDTASQAVEKILKTIKPDVRGIGFPKSPVDQAIKDLNFGASFRDPEFHATHFVPPMHLPEIPRNPIHDTNDILEKVQTDIGEIRDQAERTSKIQDRQVEIINGMLGMYVAGEKAAKRTQLKTTLIALSGLLVAVLALVEPWLQAHHYL